MTAIQPQPRIGIFGGTFDPVHLGHLHIAERFREALDLERIIWVPAGRPPHKSGQIVSSDLDRLAMLQLALAGSPHYEISTIEMERVGPSYTADTLERLSDLLAPATLVFLMGEDSLRDLPSWKDPERILSAAHLGVAGRPGIDADTTELMRRLPALRDRLAFVPMEELPISSSGVRARVAQDQPVSHLVPVAVARYIERHGLYRGATAET